MPSIPTDQVISNENTVVNKVRQSPALFTSDRNPFSPHHLPALPNTAKPKQPNRSPSILNENEYSTASITIPSNLPNASSKISSKVSRESQDTEELQIPQVAFPYIREMNSELAKDFEIMSEQIQTLPDELELLAKELYPVPLPNKKTLILGLEKTLVNVTCSTSSSMKIQVRPLAKKFLKEVADRFEIIIFSALSKEAVSHIVKILDPLNKYINFTLHRENCIQREGGLFIKDIRIIKNRNIEKVVIVDSSVFSFEAHLENTIYIPSFNGSEDDHELLKIAEFLLTLKSSNDVRHIVKKFAGILRILKLYIQGIEVVAGEDCKSNESIDEAEVGEEYE